MKKFFALMFAGLLACGMMTGCKKETTTVEDVMEKTADKAEEATEAAADAAEDATEAAKEAME